MAERAGRRDGDEGEEDGAAGGVYATGAGACVDEWGQVVGAGKWEGADSVAEMFSVVGSSREIQAYWTKRKENEGRSGRQTPN